MTNTEEKANPVKAVKVNAKTKTASKAKSSPKAKAKINPHQTQAQSKKTGFGMSKPPCFIPLNLVSQSGHDFVLYYNGNAPREAIFDCATSRIESALHLLEVFGTTKNAEAKTLYAVASASSLLLNDALTLLHELNPKVANLMSKH